MKNLSIYGLCCQVDHMLVVGKKDHLGLWPQISHDFQSCSGAGVVEVYEGIVFKKGKRLAVGAELFEGGQAKGKAELILRAVAHSGKGHLSPILEIYGMLP